MDQYSRIKKNSLFVLLTHLIRLFANFFLFIGIARLYGPIEFGQFTAAHTLSTVCLILAEYGFDNLLVTEIAHHRENPREIIHKYLSVKIVFAVSATILMVVIASIESVSPATRILMYLFSANVLFSSLMNFFFYVFRGLQEFHQETKITFAMNTSLLLVVLGLCLIHSPLYVIAGVFVVTRLVGIIIAGAALGDKIALREYRFTFTGKHDFAKINTFGLYGIFGTILFSIDTVLLSFISGDQQVGIYQSVIKFCTLGLLASDICVYALLPTLTQHFNKDQAQWRRLAGNIHRLLMFAGLFISFFMIVFPAELITIVYGPNKYIEAIPIMRLFGCIIGIRYFSEAGGMLLTSSHQQFGRLIVVIIATAFNFITNLIVIPKYGINGASIVALFTNLIVGIGYLYYAKVFRTLWNPGLVHYFPFAVSLILGWIFWNSHVLGPWVALPLCALILSIAIIFIGFTKEERQIILTWKLTQSESSESR
jgi:O-antigen/teichoic acid export membrane protein